MSRPLCYRLPTMADSVSCVCITCSDNNRERVLPGTARLGREMIEALGSGGNAYGNC